MQLRTDKGLCYWCDEKFSFSHKFPNKQLMMLQYEEEEESSDGEKYKIQNQCEKLHLSLKTMKGANNLGGLRFQEQFGKINVHILIDEGSSYNFTTKNSSIPEVVNRISTRFQSTSRNGHKMTTDGVVKR